MHNYCSGERCDSRITIILAALKFLVGNKTDLERLIPAESIDNFSAAFECEYTYLVSAKTGKLS